MTMIERVARALCEADDDEWEREGPEGLMEAYGPIARAALTAARDPTPAMVKAGADLALKTTIGGDHRWPDYIADLYRAMVDAALADA